MCYGLIWCFVVASLIKWQERRVPAIKHYANVAAYFPNVNCTGSSATTLKPLFTHRFTVKQTYKNTLGLNWKRALLYIPKRSVGVLRGTWLAVFWNWWQRCHICIRRSSDSASCSFTCRGHRLTCLKNSSNREVVQWWWRSQFLAGWLMSAVCSSSDKALGLSMLGKGGYEPF